MANNKKKNQQEQQVTSADRIKTMQKEVTELKTMVENLAYKNKMQEDYIQKQATKEQIRKESAPLHLARSENTQQSMFENTQSEDDKIGVFEVLDALIKQDKNNVKVHKPFKSSSKKGKAYTLEFSLDDTCPLIDQSLAESTRRTKARTLWKKVAFKNGYTWTQRWINEGKVNWTTYIMSKDPVKEKKFLDWLKSKGIEIPERD